MHSVKLPNLMGKPTVTHCCHKQLSLSQPQEGNYSNQTQVRQRQATTNWPVSVPRFCLLYVTSLSPITNKPTKICKTRFVVVLSCNSLISFLNQCSWRFINFVDLFTRNQLVVLLIFSWLHFQELGHPAWHTWLSAWLWSTDDGYSSSCGLVTVKLQNCFSKKLPSLTINPNFTFKSGEILHDSSTQNYISKLHFKNGRAIYKCLRCTFLSENPLINNI